MNDILILNHKKSDYEIIKDQTSSSSTNNNFRQESCTFDDNYNIGALFENPVVTEICINKIKSSFYQYPKNNSIQPFIHSIEEKIWNNFLPIMNHIFPVVVKSVDDYPGALQSGHYLWSSSSALAQILVDSICYKNIEKEYIQGSECIIDMNIKNIMVLHEIIKNSLESLKLTERGNSSKQINIIELGAGCGLPSIVTMQLISHYITNVHKTLNNSGEDSNLRINLQKKVNVYITDRDYGTLKRAEENYNATIKYLMKEGDTFNKINDKKVKYESIDISKLLELTLLNAIFFYLPWGEKKSVWKLIEEFSLQSDMKNITKSHLQANIKEPKYLVEEDYYNNFDAQGFDFFTRSVIKLKEGIRVQEEKRYCNIITNGDNDGFLTKNRRNKELPSFKIKDKNYNYFVANPVFNLILGSDVIYCKEVVRPLFETVGRLLVETRKSTYDFDKNDNINDECFDKVLPSVFIMAQSFHYDLGTENEIENICHELGIQNRTLKDNLQYSNDESVKIRMFSF